LKEPKIVQLKDVKPIIVEGGGRGFRLVTKNLTEAENMILGVFVANPGEGILWHTHKRPEEEAYYIFRGKGLFSWEKDGEKVELEVREGEGVYIPSEVKNQILNHGSESLIFVYVISPPPT